MENNFSLDSLIGLRLLRTLKYAEKRRDLQQMRFGQLLMLLSDPVAPGNILAFSILKCMRKFRANCVTGWVDSRSDLRREIVFI